MSIQSEIERINNAKAEIAKAISEKGVEVEEDTSIENMPALVRSIPQEGGESVEKLEIIDGTFDLATMSIPSISHTHAQIKEFINNGKIVVFRADAGVAYTFGSLVFYNLVTDRIGFQIMIQDDLGQGYMLYYFNVVIYSDDHINITPYVVNLTGMGG